MKRYSILMAAMVCLCFGAVDAGQPDVGLPDAGQPGAGQPGAGQPGGDDPAVELGRVHWNRDLASAQKRSAETDKPIFVLFQEVPG